MQANRSSRFVPDTRPLYQQLVKILKQNPENAKMTRRHRRVALVGMVRLLRNTFGLQNLHNIGSKHVQYVVETWKANDTGKGALANDLSHLRWLLDKLGKTALLPKRNDELGIEPRPRDVRQGKIVPPKQLVEIVMRLDPPTRALVLLGRYFGMRFEEASLFRPNYDVDSQMGLVWIKRGTKGGRPRYVPLVTQGQRVALEQVQALVADMQGCLIPKDLSYIQWKRRTYEKLRQAGLSKAQGSTFHDLRRTFAVEEMNRLVEKGRSPDEAARAVSKRLGHNRLEILSAYFAWKNVPRPPTAAEPGPS